MLQTGKGTNTHAARLDGAWMDALQVAKKQAYVMLPSSRLRFPHLMAMHQHHLAFEEGINATCQGSIVTSWLEVISRCMPLFV